MRFFDKTFSMAALSSLIGCASYAPQPLTVNHPAHAQAAVAAIPRASQTLAYTAADLPSRSAAADQGGHDANHDRTLRRKRWRWAKAKWSQSYRAQTSL